MLIFKAKELEQYTKHHLDQIAIRKQGIEFRNKQRVFLKRIVKNRTHHRWYTGEVPERSKRWTQDPLRKASQVRILPSPPHSQ